MRYEWVLGPAIVTTVDDISDVVITVDWVCLLFDDATGGEWKNSGRVIVPPVDPSEFVPFDQITQEIVESWVYSQVDKGQVESKMLADYQESLKVQILPFDF